MSNDVVVRDEQVPTSSAFEMKPRTLDEAMKFCEIMADSDLVPNGYKGKPGNIMVAIQMGQELGMTPMRALRSIAVINGRATMWGDDMLAMVLAAPVCEYIDESESTEKVGICKAKRKGSPEHVSTFTLEDAKRAGLLGKQGPWQQHTGRMLKLRARGFALRDKFADVLAGLVTAEEAYDMTVEQPAVAVIEKDQPATLKDKLRKQIETTTEPEQGATSSASEVIGSASEMGVPEADAPVSDTPDEPYKAKLRTAHDSKAVNEVWTKIPEELKQDCYGTYTDRLKALKGK